MKGLIAIRCDECNLIIAWTDGELPEGDVICFKCEHEHRKEIKYSLVGGWKKEQS